MNFDWKKVDIFVSAKDDFDDFCRSFFSGYLNILFDDIDTDWR